MDSQQMLEALKIPSGYRKPTIESPDGNAFSIFAAVGKAVKRVDKDLASRYEEVRMLADSYDTVIAVASQLVEFEFSEEDDSYDDEEDEG
jgi:hypothetical protein